MSLTRKSAFVGVYEHPSRFAPDKSMYQIMAESIRGALDDAGLTIKDVDGICAAGMGMGAMGVVGFCDYMNLTPNFMDSTNIAGAPLPTPPPQPAAAIKSGLSELAPIPSPPSPAPPPVAPPSTPS